MILQSANCNANTIVILFTGAAIDMSRWKDKVAAIVFAGFCGEALANILTGEINPSGKLSETFPLKIEDIPSFNKYQNSCIMRYEEGVDVGYRYYNSYNVDVLYPFGYGLSYSNFEYSKSGTDYDQEGIIIKYRIKNNSVVAGKEISQVYIRPLRYISS
jgi:glycoside hydrolase family 3 domain protein